MYLNLIIAFVKKKNLILAGSTQVTVSVKILTCENKILKSNENMMLIMELYRIFFLCFYAFNNMN